MQLFHSHAVYHSHAVRRLKAEGERIGVVWREPPGLLQLPRSLDSQEYRIYAVKRERECVSFDVVRKSLSFEPSRKFEPPWHSTSWASFCLQEPLSATGSYLSASGLSLTTVVFSETSSEWRKSLLSTCSVFFPPSLTRYAMLYRKSGFSTGVLIRVTTVKLNTQLSQDSMWMLHEGFTISQWDFYSNAVPP